MYILYIYYKNINSSRLFSFLMFSQTVSLNLIIKNFGEKKERIQQSIYRSHAKKQVLWWGTKAL